MQYPTLLLALLASAARITLASPLLTRDSTQNVAANTPCTPYNPGTPEQSRNDTVNYICRDFTIIFAKGSCDAGNLGVLGSLLVSDLVTAIGAERLAVQGVNYDATFYEAWNGGSDLGVYEMALMARTTLQQCPQTELVLGGYSQGAQVLHRTTETLANITANIKAVVTYGDQNYPTIPANIDGSNVQEFCATDDNVCQPALKASLTSMGGISAGHFAYLSNGDLQQAADWIKTKLLS